MAAPAVHLNALRAFEAVARLGAVKAAAAELHVTASAVSHQLHLLEARLGSRLVRRTRHGVILTPEGARLLPKLSEGFSLIAQALEETTAARASKVARPDDP